MITMIPQNDNFLPHGSGDMIYVYGAMSVGGDGDTQNPPLEVPDQHQTPEQIPAKSIN